MSNPLGGLLRPDVIYPVGPDYVTWFNANGLALPWTNAAGAIVQWYLG